MNSISKIERFVALTNVLSFLVSNRNIVMEYSRFKRVYEEYESLSIPPLIKEIEEAAPDFNALQGYFDFAKCKLNDINLPNMALLDVSELYKDDGNLRDEAIEAWDYVIEKCGELRLSILDFADRYHLRDNYPKENFLQPLFYNWIETDEKLNEGTNGKVGIVENETVQPIKEQNTSNDLMPKASSRQMLKEEELKKYFSLSFKGGGNSATKIDYFTEYLLPDLKVNRTDKDFARIALLIYDSGKLNQSMKPRTFTMWYQTFCCLVGCKYHKHYKRSNLGVDDKFKKSFNYL